MTELGFAIGLCSVQGEFPRFPPCRAWTDPPGVVISHRLSLANGAKAYELYASLEDGTSKVGLDPRELTRVEGQPRAARAASASLRGLAASSSNGVRGLPILPEA